MAWGWLRVGIGPIGLVQGRHYFVCNEKLELTGRARYNAGLDMWYFEAGCRQCRTPYMFYDDGQPPRPELGPGTVLWLRSRLAEMSPDAMVVGADGIRIDVFSYGGNRVMLLHGEEPAHAASAHEQEE